MKNTEIDGTARTIRSDEVDIWYASPKEVSESNYEEWVQKERAWVSSFNIPIRNLFIFEQGGKLLGKLCFIEEDNDHIFFAMPVIKSFPDCKYIALGLFQIAIAEARKRNVPRLETFLDDCNEPYEALKEALVEVGFRVAKQKVLYSRDLANPLMHKAGKNLTYRSVNKLEVGTVKQLFLRSLSGSLENVDASFTLTPDEEFKEIWGHVHQKGKLWKIAFYKHQPVGLVFLDIIEEKTGSFTYFAVLPEFRGQGFGDLLFVDGLNMLRSIGATQYLDSTNISNYPMIKIFVRNGCKKIMTRTEFVNQIQGDAK